MASIRMSGCVKWHGQLHALSAFYHGSLQSRQCIGQKLLEWPVPRILWRPQAEHFLGVPWPPPLWPWAKLMRGLVYPCWAALCLWKLLMSLAAARSWSAGRLLTKLPLPMLWQSHVLLCRGSARLLVPVAVPGRAVLCVACGCDPVQPACSACLGNAPATRVDCPFGDVKLSESCSWR